MARPNTLMIEAMEQYTKTIWVHFKTSAFGKQRFKEGLDLSFVLSSLGNNVIMVFSDDAVWGLLKNQTPCEHGPKIYTKNLQALHLYDIEKVYVDQPSLKQRNLSQTALSIEATLIDLADIHKQLSPKDILLTY